MGDLLVGIPGGADGVVRSGLVKVDVLIALIRADGTYLDALVQGWGSF